MKRLLFILILIATMTSLRAQRPVKIYPPGSPHGADRVELVPYINDSAKATVIVCPGGSYCWLDYKGEGIEVAQFLQQNGVNAFVLRYRVAGWWAWFSHYRYVARGNRHPDMLNDGQQALAWVHAHAAEYGIDTSFIGIMGFSAGGHLAMSEACYGKPIRPAFVALVYPVVTMSDACVHERSRRGLLGEWGRFSHRLRDSLSLERHIPADCPPIFLINCLDDPIVDYKNSVLLDSALTAHAVPHRYIQYKTGGHGFGVSNVYGTTESRPWRHEFIKWLNQLLLQH